MTILVFVKIKNTLNTVNCNLSNFTPLGSEIDFHACLFLYHCQKDVIRHKQWYDGSFFVLV